VEFQDRKLKSISLQPVELNYVGTGQPDIQSQYTSNEFLYTRGLPSAATGAKATYILERLAELSRPFSTRIEVRGEMGQIKLPN
jgi:hypothetical protein